MVASCPAQGRNQGDGAGRRGPALRRRPLPAPVPRLDFRGIAAETVGAGSKAALVLEGEVANMSSDDKPVPLIELRRCPKGTQVMVGFAPSRDSVVAGAAP
jgi:hypothetical protein